MKFTKRRPGELAPLFEALPELAALNLHSTRCGSNGELAHAHYVTKTVCIIGKELRGRISTVWDADLGIPTSLMLHEYAHLLAGIQKKQRCYLHHHAEWRRVFGELLDNFGLYLGPRLYTHSGEAGSQVAYLKKPEPDATDEFGPDFDRLSASYRRWLKARGIDRDAWIHAKANGEPLNVRSRRN